MERVATCKIHVDEYFYLCFPKMFMTNCHIVKNRWTKLHLSASIILILQTGPLFTLVMAQTYPGRNRCANVFKKTAHKYCQSAQTWNSQPELQKQVTPSKYTAFCRSEDYFCCYDNLRLLRLGMDVEWDK